MRLWVLIVAAALLAVAGCSPGDGPGPSLRAPFGPPGAYIEPPPLRAGPAPIGIGLTPVHRVTAPPKKHCQIKTKTVVTNGNKRVSRYQVCK